MRVLPKDFKPPVHHEEMLVYLPRPWMEIILAEAVKQPATLLGEGAFEGTEFDSIICAASMALMNYERPESLQRFMELADSLSSDAMVHVESKTTIEKDQPYTLEKIKRLLRIREDVASARPLRKISREQEEWNDLMLATPKEIPPIRSFFHLAQEGTQARLRRFYPKECPEAPKIWVPGYSKAPRRFNRPSRFAR